MKEVCKYLQIDTKTYRERALLSAISSVKNEMISPQEFLLQPEGDFSKQKIAEVYLEYEKQLQEQCLDFDDLRCGQYNCLRLSRMCWITTRAVLAILWWTSIRTRIQYSSI